MQNTNEEPNGASNGVRDKVTIYMTINLEYKKSLQVGNNITPQQSSKITFVTIL